MLDVILAVFASSGIWSLVLYILQRRDEKRSVEKRAMMSLLHDRIYGISVEAIERGSITVEELKNLTYLYEPYRDLGGNGTGKALYDEVTKLAKKD